MIHRAVPPEHVADHASALDGAFDELWVVEDLPFAGGVAQLASVLAVTEQAIVGHGIAPAPFRNPVALAMEWAALGRAHPGRLIGGIGHGVPAWMASIGAEVDSPLTALDEYTRAVRALLAGGQYSDRGRYVSLDGIQLEFPPPVAVPVVLGVRGPRSLALSGAVADGTVLGEGLTPSEIADAIAIVASGRRDGRLGEHRITAFVRLDAGGSGRSDGWCVDATSASGMRSSVDLVRASGVDSIVFVPTTDDQLGELLEARALLG